MKRTAPWILAALLAAGPAAAQPLDPYAPAPAPAPSKPGKGKAKRPKSADAGGAADPGGGTVPVDPYGLGAPAPAPAPAAKGGAPVDPYGAPTTPAPAPKGGAPVDPYGAPTAPAPAPKDTTPVDPYGAPPTPAPAPKDTTPVDPYGAAKPTTTPPPAGLPADPYGLGTAPTPPPVAGDPAPVQAAPPGTLDVAAVQGLLVVQGVDGWLLADTAGQNPVARGLVAPTGEPTRRWFYLVPRKGEPTILCHVAEAGAFAAVAGKRVTYNGYRDLDRALKALLKGKRTVAMEYSPKGALPGLSRIDAGTLELVRGAAVKVVSSDVLVQFVKATWGPSGRRSHYVAAHHLVELRKDALALLRERLAAGAAVTELDVQERIARGMVLRGLVGPTPRVAFGAHAGDPDYVAAAGRAATLQPGDVVLLSLAGKVTGGVYAAQTWVAVADRKPSIELAVTFEAVRSARDAALALVRDRLQRRRAVQGWEVDRAARDLFVKGGLDARALHRTGHSLDVDLYGSGTDLDDLEVRDGRNLVQGTGFTVGPGLYYDGFGVRSEVSAFLGKDGLEVTTPAQTEIEPLLAP